MENLINHANAPIIVWDSSFRITRFNNAFEKLTGLETSEVIGRQLDILFPEGSKQGSMDLIMSTLAGERWEAVEIPILRKDGSIRIALWNSANIYNKEGNEVIATIAQGQDITDRKQMENALYLNNERLKILSNTASRLLASDKPQEIVEELCNKVMKFLDCHIFFNYLFDEKEGRMHLNAFDGISDEAAQEIEWLDYGVDVCGCVARDGCRIVAENIPETPAEDNLSSQKVTLQMLRKLVYRSDVVATGREVLEALARQRYDLILMDVRMREMSGLEATKIIRQRCLDKGPVIIAITAYGLQGDRERCLEAGMDDYISKPVHLNDLAGVLHKYTPTPTSKKVSSKERKKHR